MQLFVFIYLGIVSWHRCPEFVQARMFAGKLSVAETPKAGYL